MIYFPTLSYCFTIVSSFIYPAVSMAPLCCVVLVLLCVFDSASTTFVADMDYGGVPLWIDRQFGEPSVLSLQGRMDPRWFRANNPQACPLQCDCPIQWPTALYCDHRGLADTPDHLPERTQYLFLQVEKTLAWELSVCCLYNGLPLAHSGFPFPVHFSSKVWNVKFFQTFFSFVLRATTSHPCRPLSWPTLLIYAGSSWTTTNCRATSWNRPPCRTRASCATCLPTTTT